ncbi:MAG: hypothetical protein J5832_04745, partial [Clostridia bacterium]|nr:hypothetical protein [Clostridia bacterium]
MEYKILLHKKSGVGAVCALTDETKSASYDIDGVKVDVKIERENGMTSVELTATGSGECYFSLFGKGDATLYSFNDECVHEQVLRQSPHDHTKYLFAIDGSAVPMVAAAGDVTDIFISDNPSHCDNYTTQHIIPEKGEFYLSSGDPGGAPNFHKSREIEYEPANEPYYHDLSKKPHVFRFIWVKSDAKTIKSIRRDAFLAIDKKWGDGNGSIYHAVSFASNYMHLRKNESGTSDIWIVAGIQYANTQYKRDSFWQTWILPPEIEQQCYAANDEKGIQGAENPLFYVIWSYRVKAGGGTFCKHKCDIAFNKIIEGLHKVGDGRYCPDSDENHAYRNWFDICCFEDDDADAYSQGLCVCALRSARELGYDVGVWYEKAIAFYKTLFNGEFVPLSLKKPYLALDYSIGDLLHFILFGETFIPDEQVKATYKKIMSGKAKTPYGTKIVAAPDGEYLPMEAFGAYGKVHPEMARLDLGRYANGGSYHIYEMLFHIAAYVHGADGALDNMIWRLMIDLDYDGATHEYMHTIKGNGVKANQGWNAIVYVFWDILCKRGIGDRKFFDAAEAKLKTI